MTITVAIMARNEEHIIARCIESVAPFASSVFLMDTGSEDSTTDIAINAGLDFGVMLYLDLEYWQDFAHNRSLLLERCRRWEQCGDYILMLDADDTVQEIDFDKINAQPEAGAFNVTLLRGNIEYNRVQLFKRRKPWRYEGVVHEFPVCDEPYTLGPSVGIVQTGYDSARARDPLKYLRDADTLNKALGTEQNQTTRNRYCFYLAQSYRDAGHAGAAIYWYDVVAGNETSWSEERYVALLNLGRLSGDSKHFGMAAALNPLRAEAWHALGRADMQRLCVYSSEWLFAERDKYA